MGSILLDNLTAGNILAKYDMIGEKKVSLDSTIQEYLYALVLWDNIYTIERNSYTNQWRDKKEARYNEHLKIETFFCDSSFIDLIGKEVKAELNFNEVEDLIKNDIIFYTTLASALNMNLSLSSNRSKYALENGLLQKRFNRLKLVNQTEQYVNDFYNEENEKYGEPLFSFNTPLLVDYICQNANNFSEAIEIAMDLRNDRHVVNFRKAMDILDEKINNGNLLELKYCFDNIENMVKEIKNTVSTKTIEVSISLSPSITIAHSIKGFKPKNRRWCLSFLKDLALYGLQNRSLNGR